MYSKPSPESYWSSYLSKINDNETYSLVFQHKEHVIEILNRIEDFYPIMLSIGPGWIPIICDLNSKLSRHSPEYTIAQIKEKYGALRYYATPKITPDMDQSTINHIQSSFRELCMIAEMQSTTVCENCSAIGKQRKNTLYWIKTLCDKCLHLKY